MIGIPLRAITDSKITVTATATLLYDLMDTATSGSTTKNAQAFYDDDRANAIQITPVDGDIRILVGTSPTATQGDLLKEGSKYYIPGVELAAMQLIRTGGANVIVDVVPYMSELAESPSVSNNAVNIGELGGVPLLQTPESAIDTVGQDAYATILTPSTTFSHIQILNTGSFAAVVSVDAGTSDTFPIVPPNSAITLDEFPVTTAAIQAKNFVGGNNYTDLSIIVW